MKERKLISGLNPDFFEKKDHAVRIDRLVVHPADQLFAGWLHIDKPFREIILIIPKTSVSADGSL